MYDIIGDIHGQSDKLTYLLKKMGYVNTDSGWRHSERKAIFVGDFIDRGPLQMETLRTVKAMIDAGNAYAVMGNHEFNAIGWVTPDVEKRGEFLRPHSAKNHKQHAVFLDSVIADSAQHIMWVNWFKQLPIFLEIDGIRIIHACWDSEAIAALAPYLDAQNRLRPEYIAAAFNKAHPLFALCETLLKGKEIDLPPGASYQDKDGITRTRSRIKWWLNTPTTLNQLCLIPEGQEACFPALPVHDDTLAYNESRPVFFGHYWFSDEPAPVTNRAACVDYSAALKDKALVAYRWSGEKNLAQANFIY